MEIYMYMNVHTGVVTTDNVWIKGGDDPVRDPSLVRVDLDANYRWVKKEE